TPFSLPPPPSEPLISANQMVTAIDDGTSTVVRLRGLRNANAADLVAQLIATSGGNGTAILSTAIDDSTNLLKVTFPSLQKLGLCGKANTCSTLRTELYWTEPTDRWAATSTQRLFAGFDGTRLVTVESATPKPSPVFFTATSST